MFVFSHSACFSCETRNPSKVSILRKIMTVIRFDGDFLKIPRPPFSRVFTEVYSQMYHSFSMYAKFFEKLTYLAP